MSFQMPHKEQLWGLIKPYQPLLLVLLVGILLLVIPFSDSGGTTGGAEETVGEEVVAEELEERLAAVISQIDGVGQAEVLVTFSAGSRQVLAEDQKVGENTTQTETILTKDGSNQQSTVTIQTIYPTYQGVLVVCDGGNDPGVKLRVLSAIEALTGLSSEQISICARAGGS